MHLAVLKRHILIKFRSKLFGWNYFQYFSFRFIKIVFQLTAQDRT